MSSPLPCLLEALAAAKRAGEPFDTAWQAATAQALGATCDPQDWTAVLESTRAQWQQCYKRAGHEHNRLASAAIERISLLSEDRELVERPGRICHHCGGDVPARRGGRGKAVLYCSDRCNKRASEDRNPPLTPRAHKSTPLPA
jgi:hypothetical protein